MIRDSASASARGETVNDPYRFVGKFLRPRGRDRCREHGDDQQRQHALDQDTPVYARVSRISSTIVDFFSPGYVSCPYHQCRRDIVS
jgi:hypothetical protein